MLVRRLARNVRMCVIRIVGVIRIVRAVCVGGIVLVVRVIRIARAMSMITIGVVAVAVGVVTVGMIAIGMIGVVAVGVVTVTMSVIAVFALTMGVTVGVVIVRLLGRADGELVARRQFGVGAGLALPDRDHRDHQTQQGQDGEEPAADSHGAPNGHDLSLPLVDLREAYPVNWGETGCVERSPVEGAWPWPWSSLPTGQVSGAVAVPTASTL